MLWLYDVLWSEAFAVFGVPVTLAEFIAFVAGAAGLVLLGQQQMLGWPVGLIPVVMYLFLYWETGEVLGDSLLQCVFVGVAAWGWWNWARRRPIGHELVVRRASFSELRVLAVVGVIGLVVLWAWLIGLTSSSLPLVDSATTTLMLLATYAQGRKLIESWWLWIAADIVLVALDLSRGVWVDAGVYSVFLALSIVGLLSWSARARRPVLATV